MTEEDLLGSKPIKYWDEIAKDWEETRTHRLWRVHSDAVNTRLFERWIPSVEVGRVLKTDLFDEATGETGLYPLLASVGRTAVGIDIAPLIMRRAQSQHQTLLVVGADVGCLPFADQSFDVVISNSTLDHMDSLDDVAKALRELCRVLKFGGQLLMTLDNLSNPIIALRNSLPAPLIERIGLVPYYVGASCGPRRLQKMVLAAGFEPLEVQATMHCPRVLMVPITDILDRWAARAVKKRLLQWLMAWEVLERWPTRYITGHFVALRAVRREDRAPNR
ncbi:MAG: methyltransferase domain-containing protein [Gammaproteobacteria bacterium]|nr:methyltransferase domain-containing protein [Gammaproteobacteria bacterium]